MSFKTEHKRILRFWPENQKFPLSVATLKIPEHYDGPCIVVLDNTQKIEFPNIDEATIAARLAVNLTIGGYSSAEVVVSSDGAQIDKKFLTANDWIFS